MNELSKKLILMNYDEVIKYCKNNVLEIGFASGEYLKYFLENGIKKVYGIDYSNDMINEASKRNKNFIDKNKVELKLASADNIPYPNDYFESICSINTIYFWDNLHQTINEIKRVLKPNGHLCVGFRSKDKVEKYEFTNFGFKLYSLLDAKNLFTQNGFEIVNTIEIDEIEHDAICLTVKNIK